MNLDDTLRTALRDDDPVDPQRLDLALEAVTKAAMRSRRRGRVRRVTSVSLPVTGVAVAGIGLWAILPRGSGPTTAPKTLMPELRGLREDDAWARLRALGLFPQVVSVRRGPPAAGATVVGQQPAPGDRLPAPGGRVRINVAEVPLPRDNLGDPVRRPMSAGMACIPASCDGLRVAAWPRRAAIRRVTASIEGRVIVLRPVRGTDYWQGTLSRSGIAARLLAARGTLDGWGGSRPTIAVEVRLRIHLADGRVRGYSSPVQVRSGWG